MNLSYPCYMLNCICLLLICYSFVTNKIAIIKKTTMIKLRKKKLSSGKFSIYLDIYFNGKRSYEFLGLQLSNYKAANKETLNLAQSIRAKRELEYQSYQHGFIPTHKSKINFVEFFEKMAKEKDRKNCKVYKNTLNYLRKFTNNHIQLSQINELWIAEFQKFLSSNVSINSVWTYMNSLKACINKAYREKLIQINPLHYFKSNLKKVDPKKEFLSIEEIELLMRTECRNEEVKRAFLFSCFTGLRISDVVKLEWSDVKGDMIDFRQKKTKGYEYLPLSKTAIDLLKSSRGNIHTLANGKIFDLLGKDYANTIVKEWVKSAGINKKITYHSSRHTFATLSLSQGIDLFTVSKLLGHCNVRVTQVYAKIIDSSKREAVNKLPHLKIA